MIKYVHTYVDLEKGEIFPNKNQLEEYRKRKKLLITHISQEYKTRSPGEIEVIHYYKSQPETQISIQWNKEA